jgi:hypothetical protein
MTMLDERTKTLLPAGGLLIDISRDHSLRLPLRRRAATIARDFPMIEDIVWVLESLRDSVLSVGLATPESVLGEVSRLDFTPLQHSSRLRWPGED